MGVAHDVGIGRGVADHRAQALQEDPLDLLPKDAVDDEVHRAVHGDEEVGGLGEGQEDLASMLKDNVNTVTTRNTV